MKKCEGKKKHNVERVRVIIQEEIDVWRIRLRLPVGISFVYCKLSIVIALIKLRESS